MLSTCFTETRSKKLFEDEETESNSNDADDTADKESEYEDEDYEYKNEDEEEEEPDEGEILDHDDPDFDVAGQKLKKLKQDIKLEY